MQDVVKLQSKNSSFCALRPPLARTRTLAKRLEHSKLKWKIALH